MKVLFTSIFALFLATSAWATGELSAPATCNTTDLGVSSGTLNVDLVWEANRINTSWYTGYGDNTQITGANIPTSCNYDSAISLPSAPSRPGYAFAGWTLRVSQCALPTLDSSDTGTDYGYINGGQPEPYADNALAYGLTQPQTWGATFVPGNITGSAMCSAYAGNNHDYAWGGTSSDWTADTATLTGASGSATYCWCRADAFTPTNGSECDFVPQPWVFNHGFYSTTDCSEMCASECAQSLRGIPGFRDAVYSVAVAPTPSQQQCLIPSSLVSTNGSARAAKSLDGTGDDMLGGATAETYGLTEPGQWGVSWSNGDKVVGEAKCSALPGNNHNMQWGGNSADWTATESELTNESGESQYCWCRATGYIASGAEQCSLSSPAWVFILNHVSAANCATDCAKRCAYRVHAYSSFRPALFGGLVAE